MNKDIIRIAEIVPDNPSDRERIAQAMGYRLYERTKGDYTDRWWYPANENPKAGFPSHPIPDPETSHDDCHALIEWLNGRGYEVHLFIRQHRSLVTFLSGAWAKGWQGSDYRIGIVELTLKILDESDE